MDSHVDRSNDQFGSEVPWGRDDHSIIANRYATVAAEEYVRNLHGSFFLTDYDYVVLYSNDPEQPNTDRTLPLAKQKLGVEFLSEGYFKTTEDDLTTTLLFDCPRESVEALWKIYQELAV